MRIPLPGPRGPRVQRLEAAAARHPALYKLRLALLAIAGDALLTFFQVFPYVVGIVIGMLWYPHPLILWCGALAILILIWALRPATRLSGTPLARDAAPELHAAIDRLKATLDVGARIEVALSDEMNAFVQESRGLFGILGVKRRMSLGIPLLALLDRDEAEAVIAHELGHFSRRHGRLGHWLYRAHVGWLAHAAEVDRDSSALDRLGAEIARMFVPFFALRSMIWSRRCEYEADADAARATSGEALASALMRLAVYDQWSRARLSAIIGEWQRTEAGPPRDFLARIDAALVAEAPGTMREIAAEVLAVPASWRDTHPPIAVRAAALAVAAAARPRGETAGVTILGDLWATARAGHDERWHDAIRADWLAAHARWTLVDKALVEAPNGVAEAWPTGERLARARAIRRLDPARGMTELATLAAAFPSDRAVQFALASVHLADDHPDGERMIMAVADADPRFRVPAYERLARYCRRRDDLAGEEQWLARLEAAGARRQRAFEMAFAALEGGRMAASGRPVHVHACLARACEADPVITAAWLLGGGVALATAKTPHAATLEVDALVLVVEPFHCAVATDVQAKRRDFAAVLADLTPVEAEALVVCYYATEPLPAPLAAVVASLPAHCSWRRTPAAPQTASGTS